MIEFFAEIDVKCEVKPDEDIYKGIHIKSSCQDMFIFQSQGYCSEVLSVWNYSEEVITKTSEEWNLFKTGLWKGNAYYPAFSCFTGWNCLGDFFYSNTYTDCLVEDFPVLEHLCSTSLYPINFKKTCHVVGSEKLTEVMHA